jgi:hypothetical protein
VLDAARQALEAPVPREAPAPGIIDRCWQSRRLRWGWAAACAALLAGHAALWGGARPAPPAPAVELSVEDDPGLERGLLSLAELERWKRQDPGPARERRSEIAKEPL